jgi:hypothetical protein
MIHGAVGLGVKGGQKIDAAAAAASTTAAELGGGAESAAAPSDSPATIYNQNPVVFDLNQSLRLSCSGPALLVLLLLRIIPHFWY